MSVGSGGAYTERSDMIAAQRVSDQGGSENFCFQTILNCSII